MMRCGGAPVTDMCRGIMIKGLEALVIESLTAARILERIRPSRSNSSG